MNHELTARLSVGTVLGERYEIELVLGKGGMGTVYLAKDLRLKGKRWAVKEIQMSVEYYQQFIDEAKILVELDHPNLPQMVDYYPPNQDGYSYLVMDYIKGETLVEKFERYNRALSYQQVVDYAIQICDILHYLHTRPQPIIYRDLKPSNVMVNEEDSIRLIDFGIARNYKQGKGYDTMLVGTVGFAAPEQFDDKAQTDHRTDIFSLGAMMYYLLTQGKYLYSTQKPLDQMRQDLPKRLIEIINKATQLEMNERYQSVLHFRRDLEQFKSQSTNLQKELSETKTLQGESMASFKNPYFNRHEEPPAVPTPDFGLGTRMIAVGSVQREVDSTPVAIQMAHYLSQFGKTAIIELIDTQLDSLSFQTFEHQEKTNGQGFYIKNVVYYPQGREKLHQLMQEGFQYIVMDIGNTIQLKEGDMTLSTSLEELLRAHHSILVSGSNPWNVQALLLALPQLRKVGPKKIWKICLASSEEDQRLEIEDLFPKQVREFYQFYRLGYVPDPFKLSEFNKELLQRLYNENLQVKEKKKWKLW